MDNDFLDTLAVLSVRYAIGRRTYVVTECVDAVIGLWPQISPKAREQIARDLDGVFDEQRDLSIFGDECDIREWRRLMRTVTSSEVSP